MPIASPLIPGAFHGKVKGLLGVLVIDLANGSAHICRSIEMPFAQIPECLKHILASSQLLSMVNKIVLLCGILNSSKVLLDF